MIEDFTLATFAPLVGSPFSVTAHSADGTAHEVPLVLRDATASPAPPGDRGRPPFSLVFAGPATMALAQATLPFTHEHLGTFEIFVVPIGLDGEDRLYEAVFS